MFFVNFIFQYFLIILQLFSGKFSSANLLLTSYRWLYSVKVREFSERCVSPEFRSVRIIITYIPCAGLHESLRGSRSYIPWTGLYIPCAGLHGSLRVSRSYIPWTDLYRLVWVLRVSRTYIHCTGLYGLVRVLRYPIYLHTSYGPSRALRVSRTDIPCTGLHGSLRDN